MAKYRVVASKSHDAPAIEEVINRYCKEEGLELFAIYLGLVYPSTSMRGETLIVFKTKKKAKKKSKKSKWDAAQWDSVGIGQIQVYTKTGNAMAEYKRWEEAKKEVPPPPVPKAQWDEHGWRINPNEQTPSDQWDWISSLRTRFSTTPNLVECEARQGYRWIWVPLMDKGWDSYREQVKWRITVSDRNVENTSEGALNEQE